MSTRPKASPTGAALFALALSSLMACTGFNYPEEQSSTEASTEAGHLATTVPDPPNAWVSLSSDGRTAMRLRNYAEAEQAYLAAYAETAKFPIHDARTRTALGNLVRVAGAYQANGAYRDSERVLEHVTRAAHQGRLADFGVAYPVLVAQADEAMQRGNIDGAIELYETGLLLYGVNDPASVVQRLELQAMLGSTYVQKERLQEAKPLLLIALEGVQSRFGPQSLQAAGLMVELGSLYQAEGNFAASERHLESALAIQEKQAPYSAELAVTQNRLAWLYLQHDRPKEAAEFAGKSVQLMTDQRIGGPLKVASLDTLATAEARLGQDTSARRHYVEALNLYDDLREPLQAQLIVLLDNYAAFERSTGNASAADGLKARADRMRGTTSP